jgi:hypothetical protein
MWAPRWWIIIVIALMSYQSSALHPDPGEHTLKIWVFFYPVAGSSICATKIADDVFVGNV